MCSSDLCMAGLEADWVKRVKKNDVLVGGENFGCGSSREHAPISILGAGIPVVLAKNFARIFYRNGFNMGLVLLELGDDIDKIKDTDQIEVDTATGEVKNITTGTTIKAAAVPPFMQKILDVGGLVEYVREKLA